MPPVAPDTLSSSKHRESGRRDRFVRHQLLRDRFVPSKQESAWVAPRIRKTEELEMRHPVLVVDGHPVKVFEQVEEDLGLKALDRLAENRQVIVKPENLDVVTYVLERLDNVELHLPVDVRVVAGGILWRLELLVHERENAQRVLPAHIAARSFILGKVSFYATSVTIALP